MKMTGYAFHPQKKLHQIAQRKLQPRKQKDRDIPTVSFGYESGQIE